MFNVYKKHETIFIILLFFLVLFNQVFSLTFEKETELTYNPSHTHDKFVSILTENGYYLFLGEGENDGNNDKVIIGMVSLLNFTITQIYSIKIGGSGSGFENFPAMIISLNNSYVWVGSSFQKYENGGGFHLEKISKNGTLLCKYKEDTEWADEFTFVTHSPLGIIATGRIHSKDAGIIYVFDKNCNVKKKIFHDTLEHWWWPVINSLMVVNNSFIFSQSYGEPPGDPNHYALALYKTDLDGNNIWERYFPNTQAPNAFHSAYILQPFQNFFTVGISHYPSGNITLIAFRENGTVVYEKTHPYKGVLRHGDLGWREGTVIYAGDNGFTAYLFNTTNGELLAAYNSSLPRKAYALDVKRDFIPGCYVLVGAEQISENDWQMRLERICESENLKPVADFTYKVQGLKVSFYSTSFDPDGNITRHFWNFGDGSYSFAKNPEHVFSGEGNYTVSLTVEDNKGLQSTIRKTVSVKSVFQEINFERALLQNEMLKVKIKLRNFEKVNITFAKFSASKEGEIIFHSFPTNLTPGIYLLEISSENEEVIFPIRIFNESEYSAYLKLKNLKHLAELKTYHISQELGEKTIAVAASYAIYFAKGKISEFLDKLYQKLVSKVKEEIIKFAQELKKISKNLGNYVESHSQEFAENIVSNIFEKAQELGEELGRDAIAHAFYSTVFKPEIESFEESEKILKMNEKELKERVGKAKSYLQNLEKIPVYNFSLLFFEAAPSVEYFLSKTEKSLEVPEIAPPWDLFDLVIADAQSILTLPVALELFNETQRGKFQIKALPVAAIIAGIKAYIQISATITKISPAILLFGSYTASYIASRDIIPEIFGYAGFETKSFGNEFLEIKLSSEKVEKGDVLNVTLKGRSYNEKNVYLSISQGNETIFFEIELVNGDFLKNFSFKPNASGSYLVKACLFSGAKKTFCSVESFYVGNETPVAGIFLNASGVFAKNLYSKKAKIFVKCPEKSFSFEMNGGEEKRINCSGEIELFVSSILWDKEIVEKPKSYENFCKFKSFVKNASINITCKLSGNCKSFLIFPSGKEKEISGFEELSKKGAYFVEIRCEKTTLPQGCFVYKEKSLLFAEKRNGFIAVKNEYGRAVKNAKIVSNGIERFTNESGIAFVGNSSIVKIYSPCYETSFINLISEKRVILPQNIEILESYGISWINVSERNTSRENVLKVYEIRLGNLTPNAYVILKFNNLPKSAWFASEDFSFLGNCCLLNVSRNISVFVLQVQEIGLKVELEKCSFPFAYLKIENFADSRKVKICEVVKNFEYCKDVFIEKGKATKEKFIVLDKNARIVVNGKSLISLENCSFGAKFFSKASSGKLKFEMVSLRMKISSVLFGNGLKIRITTPEYEYSFLAKEGKVKEIFTSPRCYYEKFFTNNNASEIEKGDCKNLNTAREIAEEFLKIFT